jgi:hypothetical protein
VSKELGQVRFWLMKDKQVEMLLFIQFPFAVLRITWSFQWVFS